MDNKTDRELLEAAAKAAGIEIEFLCGNLTPPHIVGMSGNSNSCYWNPLTDDGDALRLAVKLGLTIDTFPESTEVNYESGKPAEFIASSEIHGDDPYAATRRAIVRAAAAIGKTQEEMAA